MRQVREKARFGYSRLIQLLTVKVGRFFVSDLVLVVLVAAYSAIFSYVSIIRMYSLSTHAWDLGNYNQAMYTTLKGQGILHYTADIPANPSASIFGVHFSLILYLLLPIYAVAPRPETLLIIQSVFLGLAALPTYGLSIVKLGSRRKALALATVYLANPAIQGINWVEFHPEAFIVVFSLFSLYYLEKRNWAGYFASILLTLSTMEPAAFLVLLTGIYYGWRNRREIRTAITNRRLLSAPLVITGSTILVSIVWLSIALYVVHQFNPNELTLFGGLYTWQTLGATSLLNVPVAALSNPSGALVALLSNANEKLVYLLALFGPLAFLPFAALSLTAVGFAWLGVALLSDNPVYYSIATQYPAFAIPFTIAGAVHASRRLSKRGFQMFFLYAALSSAFLSPLAFGGAVGYPYVGPYGIPASTAHDQAILTLVSLIPNNASVLTQDTIFPLLSNRYDAYVIPTRSFFPIGTSFQSQLSSYVGKVSFALLDPLTDSAAAYLTIPLLKAEGFALRASSDGALLLERNYSGAMQTLSTFRRTYNYTNLSLLCCRSRKEPDSMSHWVFAHDSVSGISGSFWTGPMTLLTPGNYSVQFRVKVLSSTSNYVLTLGIIAYNMNVGIGEMGLPGQGVALSFFVYPDPSPATYLALPLYTSNLSGPTQYSTITQSFSVNTFQFLIFPGMNVSSSADIWFDNAILTQESVW